MAETTSSSPAPADPICPDCACLICACAQYEHARKILAAPGISDRDYATEEEWAEECRREVQS